MNNDRRKAIQQAIDLLAPLSDIISEAQSIIEGAASEEREYYDNMPESLQNGERGERASEAADALEEAQGALEELPIDDIIAQLEGAME